MPGFWELPQVAASRLGTDDFYLLGIRLGKHLGEFKHAITFRSYRGTVYQGHLEGDRPEDYRWVGRRRLASLPVTTISKKALAAVAA